MDKNFAELHVHTNNSISDAVSTIDDILIRCKELGINSVAITDHGIVMGVREFYDKAKTYGIKPLLGVEAYYDDGTEYMNRGHVCIYAKDEQGYWAIMQAVSESNREGHLIEKKIFNRVKTFPTMNAEIFTRYFGTGSKGWNHVILTSACAGGILSGYTMWNIKIDKEIDKIKKKIAALDDFDNPAIRSFYDMYSNISQEYDQKRALLKQVKKEAGINISAKKQRLSKIKDADKASIMQQEITELENKASYAKTLIPSLESEILSLKDKMTQMKASVQKIEKTRAKYENYMEQIAQLEMKKLPEDILLSKMETQVISICDIVGKNNFYIELQYHGLENEKYAKSLEILIARKLQIKLCAANDAHFVRKKDWKIRKIIQTLAFEKYTNPGVDEKEYYIKTEEELRDALLQAFEADIVDCALQGTYEIAESCNTVLSKGGEFYPKYPVPAGMTSSQILWEEIQKGIRKRFPNGFPSVPNGRESYEDRIKREFNIINSMGFCDYLLIVADFINYCKDYSKKIGNGIGYGIGPGRGSGAGCEINYLIGITNIDPIPLDLLFERFLNPARVSMPDIDTDFSREVRDAGIEYVKKKYGDRSVCLIATVQVKGGKAGIRDYAKFLALYEDADKTDIDKQKYSQTANIISKSMPKDVKNFSDFTTVCDAEGESKKILVSDFMLEKFAGNSEAEKIIKGASLIEGIPTGFSAHAAGVIISDNDDVSTRVPVMWSPGKQQFVAQCNMLQAEDCFGLLKMDFLGLKNLDILTMAARLIMQNYGIKIDFDNLLQDKSVYKDIISTGTTNGIFQLESLGMKKFMTELQPSCLEELIAGVALYRPGPMDFIPRYIEGKKNPEKVTYECPQLKPILSTTYGCIVYQEQVMQIFQDCAGFSLGRADLVRRAMSKKKEKYLEEQRKAFVYGNHAEFKSGKDNELVDGCVNRNISEEVANKLFDKMLDFAKYAFNKSHAACYAYIAYQTAYLKKHYPLEFYAALFSFSGKNKRCSLVSEIKSRGIKILCPDINSVHSNFGIRNNSLIWGLGAIEGINNASCITDEVKKGYFTSFDDFIRRVKLSKDMLISLIDAGAFDSMGHQREALKHIAVAKLELAKSIRKMQEEYEKLDNKTTPKAEEKKEQIKSSIKEFYEMKPYNTKPLNRLEELKSEKAALGVYISGHPLDNYPESVSTGFSDITSVGDGDKVKLYGYVETYRINKKKSTGEDMAFFDLETKEGSIGICMFAKAYAAYGNLLKEDSVVGIEGYIKEKEIFNVGEDEEESDDRETILECHVQRIIPAPRPKMKRIVIVSESIVAWKERDMYLVSNYKFDEGAEFIMYDKTLNQYRKGTYRISYDILNEIELVCYIE